MQVTRVFALSWFVIALCASVRPMAADVVIRGLVTDGGGKPIAGALVKATGAGSIKSISRYTGADGRYELAVPAGQYNVVAGAYWIPLRRTIEGRRNHAALNFSLDAELGRACS